MALSKTQMASLTRVRAAGNSTLDSVLDNEVCSYLLAVVVTDLGVQKGFKRIPRRLPLFFGKQPLATLRLSGLDFLAEFERLVSRVDDGDAYFFCLAKLHKARLKYDRILRAQPMPTFDQVGPRGLLQYGSLSPEALAALLFWRKWMFDIDNRAAQETGYLFEPVIAHAIGGVPFGSQKSPIKRKGGTGGRQVDCLREDTKRAYEFKLRVTIAASGQGRWEEELEFPVDVKSSGYKPVLVVLDPTPNPKLDELCRAFHTQGGDVFIGADAWKHLEEEAGPTMAKFLEKYIRTPIQSLLDEAPKKLPDLLLSLADDQIVVRVGDEQLTIERQPVEDLGSGANELPSDVDEDTPVP